MVTDAQLCEHLTPKGIEYAHQPGRWDVMILCPSLSLSKHHVRLDRVAGGYRVTHGKYRELRKLPA